VCNVKRSLIGATLAGVSLAALWLGVFMPVASGKPEKAKELVVTGPFAGGAALPKKYTDDGADMSPALKWTALPPKTASIAVICTDPDAPRDIWYHWLLFNLPPRTAQLQENVPKQGTVLGGALQGTNDFNKLGYNGPAPPPGKLHHYHFQVMALDAMLPLRAGVHKEEFKTALAGHILMTGELVGTYKR
jgi:Raf kinase inhibitor-like YbhB/YbcL family protein